MRASSFKILTVFAALGLTACASGEPKLMNVKSTQEGPDEFAILPTKPLQEPDDYKDLPAPTPGGTNLSDPTPHEDAISALGGKPRTGGIRGGEGALVSATGRYGVTGNIRQQLAAEDREWRKDHNGRLLERLFNVNVYYRAYDVMHLDQHYELERLRLLGLWTPAAPPDPSRVE